MIFWNNFVTILSTGLILYNGSRFIGNVGLSQWRIQAIFKRERGSKFVPFPPKRGEIEDPKQGKHDFSFLKNQLRGGAFQPSYPLCINFPKYVQVSRCTVALNTPNALTSHTDTSRTSACYKLPLFSTICLYLVTLLRIFPFIFHS